ncbi:SRPBCC domain-containing protein [Phenylobacterium sp.]|uniref:SRPBCC family protein n=1 Tax=Phenylobacterium sp. TaxID=1871053 RepID=UPI0035658E14
MTQKTGTVRATHRYDAAPERVFDAWLDPAIAGKFLFATPTGRMIKAEIDPRVGGGFTFTDRRPDMGDVEHVGTYIEIDRPRRLVFDFAVPAYEPTLTRITLDFAPSGSGCELTLTHQGVFEAYVKQTQSGWAMILDGLAKALA